MTKDYPIFEKWFIILNWLLDITEKIPKTVRFSIAIKIQNLATDILDSIIEAIYTKDKLPIFTKINLYLEKIRIYARLSFVRKYLNEKQYNYISKELNEVGKMIGGWSRNNKE